MDKLAIENLNLNNLRRVLASELYDNENLKKSLTIVCRPKHSDIIYLVEFTQGEYDDQDYLMFDDLNKALDFYNNL